jgi:hypothetical protein
MSDSKAKNGARKRFDPILGSPYQPGEVVRVVPGDDGSVPEYIGGVGVVLYLEYDCGCGQTFPCDPMIGVRLDDGREYEFWRDELESCEALA